MSSGEHLNALRQRYNSINKILADKTSKKVFGGYRNYLVKERNAIGWAIPILAESHAIGVKKSKACFKQSGWFWAKENEICKKRVG